MKRLAIMLVAVVPFFANCSGEKASLTGSYGDALLSGQVVLADASSPAGITVAVDGMVSTLDASGRFMFPGVGNKVMMRLHRASDGIDASINLSASANVVVEVSAGKANGRRRGVAPSKSEYEGVIVNASATSLVMLTSHKEEVTIAIDASTVIRKGNTTVAAADLKTGDRVHVKASVKDGTLTATQVVLQGSGSDDDDDSDDKNGSTMTANGLVTAAVGTTLKVQSQPKGEVTVQTDANTIIKRQGDRITVADIKPGDEVNAMGTRIDATTLLARQIEVRGNSKNKK